MKILGDSERLGSCLLLFFILIINQFQSCKLESHFGKELKVNLDDKSTYFLQPTLHNVTRFYLHDQSIENSQDFDLLLHKTGLSDIKILKDSKIQSQKIVKIDKIIFIEDFYGILYYFYTFYRHTFECITNKSSTQSEKNKCSQDVINNTSIYRKYLSTIVKTYVLPDNENRLFDIFVEIWELRKEAKNFGCSTNGESTQMKIRNFLGIILFVMMQNYSLLSYIYLHYYPEVLKMKNLSESIKIKNSTMARKSFTDDGQEILLNLKHDIHLITKEALKAIKYAPTDLRRCDPPKHIKNVTYQRLTNFIQAWVGSEEYLNRENQCGFDCKFKQTEFYNIFRKNHDKKDATIIGNFDERLIYDGVLRDCKLTPDFEFIYKQIEPPDSERIYHHLTEEKGFYGSQWGKSYQPFNYTVVKFSRKAVSHLSSTSSQGILNTCKMCLCQLERIKSESIRSFSSIPVIVPSKRVVTGIRWIIRNGTVYLELRGTKFVNYILDFTSTSEWYTRHGGAKRDELIVLDYDGRSLRLDDISVPENMFVTGAKFVLINGLICLSVRGVSITQSGDINHNINGWYFRSIGATTSQKMELMLDEPDCSELAPTNENAVNKELSIPGKTFIKFQPTDFKKDAAQTTVPYFDIQEVVTDPPTPIRGLGIYYKGKKGFGGFVGLKILTADIAGKFINNETLDRDFQAVNHILEFAA